jgi:hypothetical protein
MTEKHPRDKPKHKKSHYQSEIRSVINEIHSSRDWIADIAQTTGDPDLLAMQEQIEKVSRGMLAFERRIKKTDPEELDERGYLGMDLWS